MGRVSIGRWVDTAVVLMWAIAAVSMQNWAMLIVVVLFFLQCMRCWGLEKDNDDMAKHLEKAAKVLKAAEQVVDETMRENKVLTHNLQIREQQLMEYSGGVHREVHDPATDTGTDAQGSRAQIA